MDVYLQAETERREENKSDRMDKKRDGAVHFNGTCGDFHVFCATQ